MLEGVTGSTSVDIPHAADASDNKYCCWRTMCTIVGAVTLSVGMPYILKMIGFGKYAIRTNSIAFWMVSTFQKLGGRDVPMGTFVNPEKRFDVVVLSPLVSLSAAVVGGCLGYYAAYLLFWIASITILVVLYVVAKNLQRKTRVKVAFDIVQYLFMFGLVYVVYRLIQRFGSFVFAWISQGPIGLAYPK